MHIIKKLDLTITAAASGMQCEGEVERRLCWKGLAKMSEVLSLKLKLNSDSIVTQYSNRYNCVTLTLSPPLSKLI